MNFTNKVFLVHGAIAVQWWLSVCLLVGRCYSHCTMCPARIVTAGYYIPPRNGGPASTSRRHYIHQQALSQVFLVSSRIPLHKELQFITRKSCQGYFNTAAYIIQHSLLAVLTYKTCSLTANMVIL